MLFTSSSDHTPWGMDHSFSLLAALLFFGKRMPRGCLLTVSRK